MGAEGDATVNAAAATVTTDHENNYDAAKEAQSGTVDQTQGRAENDAMEFEYDSARCTAGFEDDCVGEVVARPDEQADEQNQLYPVQDIQDVFEGTPVNDTGPSSAPVPPRTPNSEATNPNKSKKKTIAASRAAAAAALKSHKSINAETTDISRY